MKPLNIASLLNLRPRKSNTEKNRTKRQAQQQEPLPTRLTPLITDPTFLQFMAQIDEVQLRQEMIDRTIEVQQIPSPTDGEQQLAQWVATYFQELGLETVIQTSSDPTYTNVYARLVGQNTDNVLEDNVLDSESPPNTLLVSAHMDTVFSLETSLDVRFDVPHNRIYGPGIGDNSIGLAGMLTAARLFKLMITQGMQFPVDIVFVANSGEEGNGNLRGMRAALEQFQIEVGACIVIEGMGIGRIVHQALGSRRFRIIVTAPGGHSWSDFGSANAIHVLAQIAADLSRLQVPITPRTTFNIGLIEGGTSINTIAQQAMLELDLRSEAADTLDAIVKDTVQIVRRYQTQQWRKMGVSVEIETIGERPTGGIPDSHPLVHSAEQAIVDVGLADRVNKCMSSTDANIPLSRGFPSVCIGITQGGNAHRTEEWIDTTLIMQGLQQLLRLTWWTTHWLRNKN